jgi:hypothetical protein
MARRKKSETQWEQLSTPPPPLFTGVKEKDFVKQVNDELIERVIGQQIAYFSIDIDRSGFHPIYGEAIEKTFLPPVRVYALVKWEGQTNLFTEGLGIDKQTSIEIHFHKRRLTEDQDLYVREGDFVLYGDRYYEIVSTAEPKQLFGQAESKFEIVAKCKRARDSLFAPKFSANTVPTRRETTSTATPNYGGNGIVRPGGGGGSGSAATFTNITATGNLTVSGSTILGDSTSDSTTVNGAITLNGSLYFRATLVSSSYTVVSTDYIIGANSSGSSFGITLPSVASTTAGRVLIIKDETGFSTTNPIYISASSGETIDGDSVITINSEHTSIGLYCTSTGWHII